jgi:cytochrome c oxidase subunit IV
MTDQHAAHAEPGAAEPHGEHAHPNYWAVFGALCILTVASVIADQLGGAIGKTLLALAVLTVAVLKAMFVMLYFMHLKFEGKWKYVLLAPTMILAVAIIAALSPDIAVHYYDVNVPQATTPLHEEGDSQHSTEPAGDRAGPAQHK